MFKCFLIFCCFWTFSFVTGERDQCPEFYTPILRKCYHFSEEKSTWQDAHFKCLNLNGSLAMVTKSKQEMLIRHYLNTHVDGKKERWLGGKFNEKLRQWVWGATGKPLEFQAFSRMNYKDQKWAWHCIITDPFRQNKWSARSCFLKKRYICQTPSNLFMAMKKSFKRNFDQRNCNNSKITDFEKEMCKKLNAAPAYLVKNAYKKTRKLRTGKAFVCPSHMILIGKKCYFFSKVKENWNDAYWACRDNKTKIATIFNQMQDNTLREFLNRNFIEKQERWIGAIFDWKQNQWKWAMSGEDVKYKNFAKGVTNKNHTQHCITLDPHHNNQWNSQNRMNKLPYICQAKAKTVLKSNKIVPYLPNSTIMQENSSRNHTRIITNSNDKELVANNLI